MYVLSTSNLSQQPCRAANCTYLHLILYSQAQADQGTREAGVGERAGDLAAPALDLDAVHRADRHPGRGPRVQRRLKHDAVDDPRAPRPGPRRRGLRQVQHRQDPEDQERQALGALLAPVSQVFRKRYHLAHL